MPGNITEFTETEWEDIKKEDATRRREEEKRRLKENTNNKTICWMDLQAEN